MAKIYEQVNDHKKAINHYQQTLRFLTKNSLFNENGQYDFLEIKAETLLKIGNEYLAIPSVDSAVYYFEELLKVNSFKKDIRTLQGTAYSNLSGIYFYNTKLRDLVKAEDYSYKAIEIHKELNNNQSLAAAYTNLGSIYMEKENPKKAKELYFKALDFIKDDKRLKAVKYREVLYDNIGWAMYNLQDYVSYDYLDKSIGIRDSLSEVSKVNIIKELEIKHNNDSLLREAEAKEELAKQNTWLVGGIGVSTAMLLLFLASYYKLRQRNLSLTLSENKLVQQKNIEKIKADVQAKILNATLDGKEVERKLIAETLHDNVSAMLSSANLHLQASQKQFKGDVPLELKKLNKLLKKHRNKLEIYPII